MNERELRLISGAEATTNAVNYYSERYHGGPAGPIADCVQRGVLEYESLTDYFLDTWPIKNTSLLANLLLIRSSLHWEAFKQCLVEECYSILYIVQGGYW
jgi:hypothetical protein